MWATRVLGDCLGPSSHSVEATLTVRPAHHVGPASHMRMAELSLHVSMVLFPEEHKAPLEQRSAEAEPAICISPHAQANLNQSKDSSKKEEGHNVSSQELTRYLHLIHQ